MSLTKVEWSPRGITIPPGMKFEEWQDLGRNLRMIEGAIQFAIGDWLNYGEIAYGQDDKYLQAIEETGYTHGTLRNIAWVSREIAPHERDPDITFSHYRALAALPRADRAKWVQRLKEDPMPVGEFRGRLKAKREVRVMTYIDEDMLSDIKVLARTYAPDDARLNFREKWREEL